VSNATISKLFQRIRVTYPEFARYRDVNTLRDLLCRARREHLGAHKRATSTSHSEEFEVLASGITGEDFGSHRSDGRRVRS
jgi:hypothetical protein